MQKTLAFALCAAVGAAASAHPLGEQWSQKPVPGPVGGVDAPIEVDEDFESYQAGDGMTTMGGWEVWPGGLDATITDQFAASGSLSADFSLTNIDIIHQFSGITSGQVTYSANTYFPTGSDGALYLIALNGYDGGGAGTSWSIQVRFDPFIGTLTSEFAGETTPLIYDEWVEWRAEIDLDADTINMFYDGVQFVTDGCWTCTVQGSAPGTGAAEFAAIDLYTQSSLTGTDFYLDDILVETSGGGGCYPDCDLSGSLDFFDFLCFQNAFAVGDLYADCDTSGSLDFFDFLCFQNEFAIGCP